MSVQSFGVNDEFAVKVWSRGLEAEVLKKTSWTQYLGKTSSSLIQWKDELNKSRGDRIRVGLRMQLDTEGVAGNTVLEGNESEIQIHEDDLVIEQMREAVRFYEGIDTQRVPFRMREEARHALTDWFSDRLDEIFFNHIAGYTPQASVATRNGHNTITAPSTGRQLWGGTSNTADEDLADNDDLTPALIDEAIYNAKTLTPALRPVKTRNGEYFVLFIHPGQTNQLRDNASDWFSTMQAAMQGGRVDDNPLFTGALGVWNGALLVENARVPNGVNSSTGAAITGVRRAILCGAQSALFASTQDGGSPSRFNWSEETFDYNNELGIAASLIFGLKKTVFDNTDFGTIVLSTWGTL